MIKKKCNIVFLLIVALLSACDEYPVTSITLDRSSLTMNTGEIYHLECIIQPLSSAYANSVIWKSSDPSVATVNSSGVVTAVYSGECVITASAGNQKAVCQVVVNPLEYSFSFDRAGALFYGDAYEIGSHNFVLRLLGEGLTMDNDGVLSGEGIFVNLDIELPLTDLKLTEGTYNLSTERTEYTFAPGQIYEESGTQYAIGTFVGQRTSEGLRVIFVKSGSFWITFIDEIYRLEGHLVGEKDEDIVLSFQGKIPVIDKTGANLPETITLNPTSVKVDFLGDVYGVGLNVFRHTITHASDTVLQLEYYVPLSITDRVLLGTYLFSSSTPYSLVPASIDNGVFYGAWITDINGHKKIIKGQIIVSRSVEKQVFNCRLIDESGRTISVSYN
ncbi:MAG TPA: Ig-like domain-containing protein [Paludibacteraceae bacterium]|nr:Ig-like domain-containing protein [Paludibacteraceae bacterium]HQB69619.1 Ig-like domain-containing protein [Paludibacteraceae bacterium]